jgi:LCP family protein required for cell wall assembly
MPSPRRRASHRPDPTYAAPVSTPTSSVASSHRRVWLWILAGSAAASVLIVTAASSWPIARAWSDRTTFAFTSTDTSPATIVAIVGTDARPGTDATQAEKDAFGDRATLKGARADTVLLVRFGGDKESQVVNLPRDLVIDSGPTGRVGRVAIAWLDGPQGFASTLCSALGIGIDEVVVADPVTFIRTVDAIGGLEVESAGVLRDQKAQLDPTADGSQTLGGTQALAWVRARNLEVLRDGEWAPLADKASSSSDQSVERTARSREVVRSLTLQLAQHPHRIAAATTAALSGLEFSSSLNRTTALSTLRTVTTNTAVVPEVRTVSGAVPAALLTDAGRDTLRDFSSNGACSQN